jgi:Ca2+-transporting ATPase
MCSVAFENEPAEPDIMQHPPRPLDEPLVGPAQLLLGVMQGAVLLLVCLALYGQQLQSGQGESLARTLAFIALTAGNLMLVQVNASRRGAIRNLFSGPRRAFWLIAAGAGAIVAICIGWPPLRGLFGFALPEAAQALLAAAVGLAGGAVLELGKWHPWVRRTLGQQAHRAAARG